MTLQAEDAQIPVLADHGRQLSQTDAAAAEKRPEAGTVVMKMQNFQAVDSKADSGRTALR